MSSGRRHGPSRSMMLVMVPSPIFSVRMPTSAAGPYDIGLQLAHRTLRAAARKRNPREGHEDTCARFDRASYRPGNLGGAAGAAVIVDGNFEDAQPRCCRAHLHLDIPAVCRLAHSQAEQRFAADGAEGAHVGVVHPIEESDARTRERARRKLMPRDAPGLASGS